MEERKWENLEMDCLVNVLGRVGMESLLLDVPFVCKSWHEASLNPLSWKCLVFTSAADLSSDKNFINRFKDIYRIKELSDTAFIKFIIDRSCRIATKLVLPTYCSQEALEYAANECPALETLGFSVARPSYVKIIGKWKNLGGLIIEVPHCFRNHDRWGFRGFFASIEKDEISTIITSVPKIKFLDISWRLIERESLITILQGCKELTYLDVSNCEDFEVDKEILEHASHITTFKYQGSRVRPEGARHQTYYDFPLSASARSLLDDDLFIWDDDGPMKYEWLKHCLRIFEHLGY